MTHLLDSYFVRMKFSIFASDGVCPAASFASQYLFARLLPHFKMFCSCSSVQASRSTDLTLLICVPMPRWIPEQRMQTNTPRFQLAQRGCLFRLQSAQTLLPSSLTRALSVWAFCEARSLPAGRRDMAGTCRSARVRMRWPSRSDRKGKDDCVCQLRRPDGSYLYRKKDK